MSVYRHLVAVHSRLRAAPTNHNFLSRCHFHYSSNFSVRSTQNGHRRAIHSQPCCLVSFTSPNAATTTSTMTSASPVPEAPSAARVDPWTFFNDKLGAPSVALAPMTDASDYPFAKLCERHGVPIAFSPMLYARYMVEEPLYKVQHVNHGHDPNKLIIQFCAKEPELFATAVQKIEDSCVAVDLNLCWSSPRAVRGGYGTTVLEDVDHACRLIEAAQAASSLPITCKIRCLPTMNDTVAMCKRLEEQGVVMLTVEGRTPTDRDASDGFHWETVRAVKEAVGIPVAASGGVDTFEDIQLLKDYSGVDLVLLGRSLLYNPYLLEPESTPSVFDVLKEYLALFRKTPVMPTYARMHMLYMLHLVLCHMPDLADEVKLCNSAASLEMVLDDIHVRFRELVQDSPKLTALEQCQARPRGLEYVKEHKRFPDDRDQRQVALEWEKELLEQNLLPQDHRQRYSAMHSFSKKAIRKLNGIAKRRMKRQAHQERDKEAKREARQARQDAGEHSVAGTARTSKEQKSEGSLEEPHDGDGAAREETRKKAKLTGDKRVRRAALQEKMASDEPMVRVAVDLSLGDAMSRKEIFKLSEQIRRLYGANLWSDNPCHVHFTGLNKRSTIFKTCRQRNTGFEDYVITMTDKQHHEYFSHDELVFMTPDSPNVLVDLLPSKVYVLGGLVDEQIQRNFTLDRASQVGIKTARLPVLELSNAAETKYAPVLSINQVFDGFLKLNGGGTWYDALSVSVPTRKGFRLHSQQEIEAKVAELRAISVDGLADVPPLRQGQPTEKDTATSTTNTDSNPEPALDAAE
eukprot:m.279354 g.279354  ORF g.279354 m.279354 type:complete len:802 (-) comp15742_c0_seq2:665-3070(-)